MRLTAWTAGTLAVAGALALPADSRAGGVHVGIVFVDHGYGYRDTYRIGYDRGMQDGLRHGARDGHHGEDYNFWHDRRYRSGDAGYKDWHGPRYLYVEGYRRGYEMGYRRAYAGTRHRHPGQEGYCYLRHDERHTRDRYDRDDDRFIYEEPRDHRR